MERNVNIIDDLDGGKIVVINNVIFKGRQKIGWQEVEQYLKQFVGKSYNIIDTNELIFIGSDLPDEFTGSNDTKFALPVYNETQELERFNIFKAVLLFRHAYDGRLCLYDLVNIKKEAGKPLEQ